MNFYDHDKYINDGEFKLSLALLYLMIINQVQSVYLWCCVPPYSVV